MTTMASATRTPSRTSPLDQRVYHPLDQLRGIIRRYVVIEGLLSALIFLGIWFALALVLDYVVFKAFTWDWVQDGTRWIRVAALAAALVILAGIVVFRIVRRLTTEFSYPALALVLERRFPKVLGDRLITAVEMADIGKAQEFGYSADMIQQTISEARDRVGTVPVSEVFNWRRLSVMGVLAIGIPLATTAVAFGAYFISTRSVEPARAAWRFYHVSCIVGERDVLLMNTPWPRRALLQLQGDANDGLRVARDGAAPRIRVKSYQWVIVDRNSVDGWRPLMWSDVTDALVGMPVPAVPFSSLGLADEPTTRTALGGAAGAAALVTTTIFPDENPNLPQLASQWTVDAMFDRAQESDSPGMEPAHITRLKSRMGNSAFRELQSVLGQLNAIANDPSYGRTLRRLQKPDAVTFSYTGDRTAGSGTLSPEGNNEFAGEISGLKENVHFVVKAEDYRTPPKSITLIPPPILESLTRVEYQPAYLHYAQPLGEGYSALAGLRQQMPEERLSLTGDKSVFVVPSGTEVVITGVGEQPIANAWVVPKIGRVPGAKPGSAARVPLRIPDRAATNGVRPLLWSEVTEALLGVPVPEFNPATVTTSGSTASRPDSSGWTADEVVKLMRDNPARVREVVKGQQFEQLEKVFSTLDATSRDESGKYVLRLGRTFNIAFRGETRITALTEFDLVFENHDRVSSTRAILIQATEDQAPGVEIETEVIRRVGDRFYVTPRAKIPFNPNSYVKDDQGLSKVEYTYTVTPEDSEIARTMRAGLISRAILPPVLAKFPAAMQGLYHLRAHSTLDKGDNRTFGSGELPHFTGLLANIKRETKAHLTSLLGQPLSGEKPEMIKRFTLETRLFPDIQRRPNGSLESFKWQVDGDYFDVSKLGLEVQAGDVQGRYRIEMNLLATDTNYDTGPRTGTNVEPIKLLVVSPGDLLVEIGKEEEALALKLDEALTKLAAAKSKYAFVNSKHITRQLDELDAVRVRAKDAAQDIVKARELVLGVARAYRKLERECVVNQLDERTIVGYGKFANRLARVLGENTQPVSPDEDDQLRDGSLTPEGTFPNTEKLIATVQTILDGMEPRRYAEPAQATDADLAINNLEREIIKIRRLLGEAQNKDKLRKDLLALIESQERIRLEVINWERELNKILTSEEPAISPMGLVFLAKGESKKITHKLAWRQYKKDDLNVKITVSDPAGVTVPAELKLNFENHQFEFTYEIRGGTKDGEFTVTVMPEVGNKVEYKVTVK